MVDHVRIPRSTPEEQGIAYGAILKFIERAEREIHDCTDL